MAPSVFNEIVQLRNPAELPPSTGAGDVVSRVYFCSVLRKGTNVAVVVSAPRDSDRFQHGTVAHVVGSAWNINDTLYVDATSIAAVESAVAPCKFLEGVPVISAPRRVATPLRLIDITVTKRKNLPAPVTMRCQVSGRAVQLPGLGPVYPGTEVVLEGKVVDFSGSSLAIRLHAIKDGAPSPGKRGSTLDYAAYWLTNLISIVRGSRSSVSCIVSPDNGDVILHA